MRHSPNLSPDPLNPRKGRESRWDGGTGGTGGTTRGISCLKGNRQGEQGGTGPILRTISVPPVPLRGSTLIRHFSFEYPLFPRNWRLHHNPLQLNFFSDNPSVYRRFIKRIVPIPSRFD